MGGAFPLRRVKEVKMSVNKNIEVEWFRTCSGFTLSFFLSFLYDCLKEIGNIHRRMAVGYNFDNVHLS